MGHFSLENTLIPTQALPGSCLRGDPILAGQEVRLLPNIPVVAKHPSLTQALHS